MRPPNALIASEWDVLPCHRYDAVDLLRLFHYTKGAANTAVAAHGLYRRADGVLGRVLGATLWMPPLPPVGRAVAGDDWRGVLVLSRLVLAPEVPTNGASFLLGRSMRLLDRDRWPVLVTYADGRLGHTGAIYRATNWTDDGDVDAGDLWVDSAGVQRGRRRGPVTLTFDEMRADGLELVPAAKKRRFVHRA